MPNPVGRPKSVTVLADPTNKGEEVEAEHAAIDAVTHIVAEAVEAHVPAPVASLISEVEPEIKTKLYAVTGVVTKDFKHLAEKYIIEFEESMVKDLHDAALRAVIAARIWAKEGHAVIESALNIMEVTGAKAIFHG